MQARAVVWKNLAELGVRRENNVNVLWMTHIPPLKKLLNLFLSIDIFKESQYTCYDFPYFVLLVNTYSYSLLCPVSSPKPYALIT